MIDVDRLRRAYETARRDLLAEQAGAGRWVGELSGSALSTATAISALSIVARESAESNLPDRPASFEPLIARAVDWLGAGQNGDGGWGDTDQSHSNVATTMLVRAALHLAGAAPRHADRLCAAERYLDAQGGIPGLRRRYGRDKTFAVPILTNCALAGLVDWREVAPLPFELACLPQGLYRFLRLPVVSYAIPALVAIGQARYVHRRPLNPGARLVRRLAVRKSLDVLERMQPDSGGFLEATPLTSFVVMSLAGSGRVDHPVVRRGVDFLVASVRDDGSWPIDTNLATWVTTLAINALAASGEDLAEIGCLEGLDGLLSCQHRRRHPFTGADPGGWGWTDLSGAVPDADDTPGALLALAALRKHASPDRVGEIDVAADRALVWLLDLQNSDGGWPTFCRGWGKLPFDRSSVDLTAHAIRAIRAWREWNDALGSGSDFSPRPLRRALRRGLAFLDRHQRSNGSWVPLWFGNQDHPEEENPVYGTARVLLAYRDLGGLHEQPARKAVEWLVAHRNADGGWGGSRVVGRDGKPGQVSSIEETAVAVEALASAADGRGAQAALDAGLRWLVEAVESGDHRRASPIGFYFAKLWYYEKLYPLIFTVSALGRALGRVGSLETRRGIPENAR